LLKILAFLMISVILFSLALARPAYSALLELDVATNKHIYNVKDIVTFTGGVNNGSAVPDAIVLFEVDTPKNATWIIRTLATGPTPSPPPPGYWPVEVLNVTPSDSYGRPVYSFKPGQDAGFRVTVRNNGLSDYQGWVAINVFFSNGLPFAALSVFNGTFPAGQTFSAMTWPVNIPTASVVGQAMVYASVFSDYPKNGGLAYSPETSAAFNISSGTPAQTPPSSPPGNFSLIVPLSPSTASMPILLGNYTVYARTFIHYLVASAQTMFTVKLFGDTNLDQKIDMKDISFIARHFGTYGPGYLYPGSPPSPNWNATADVTGPNGVPEGKVDMRDIAITAKNFGVVAKADP
jgi:hypothetical protein